MTTSIPLPEDPETRAANVRYIFLTLWTKAYDGPRYNKQEWTLLDGVLQSAGLFGKCNSLMPQPPYDPHYGETIQETAEEIEPPPDAGPPQLKLIKFPPLPPR